MNQPNFYDNDVIDESFDWATAGDNEALSQDRSDTTMSRLSRCVTAAVVGSVLTFGPIGLSGAVDTPVLEDRVVVTVEASGLEQIRIPESHRLAADRFSRMFKPVALDAIELGDDPDYGL